MKKLFAIIFILSSLISHNIYASDLYVQFIDVGQADSALLISNDEAILIDGGNANDSQTVLDTLYANNISKLDYVIQTHAHEDHMGGLVGVAKAIPIDTILRPSTTANSAIYNEFNDIINNRSINVINPDIGERYIFGQAVITILGPVYEDTDDLNNTSIVCRIDYGNTSFLFTGDASFDEENDILANNYYIDCDVLKVSHHGSKTASSKNFLDRVTPTYSVISVGANNSYKHPTEAALSRLNESNSKIYRTDKNGNVYITSDGVNLTLSVDIEYFEADIKSEYIGNIKTKKYHLDSCSNLPTSGNRVFFKDSLSAVEAGYTPCGLCNP